MCSKIEVHFAELKICILVLERLVAYHKWLSKFSAIDGWLKVE